MRSSEAPPIARDFDRHWADHEPEAIAGPKLEGARRFLAPLLKRPGESAPLRVLDAGCGDGVHAVALQPAPVRYVGLDISAAALSTAQRRRGGRGAFVRGDAGCLPFRDAAFDAAFSFGVLAYTDDPPRGFAELCRVTRPGGLVGLWVYPRRRGLAGLAFRLVRGVCRLTGRVGARMVADCLVPVLGLLPTRSGLSLRNATWRQCREVVLVNIAPRKLAFYDREELLKWFDANDVELVSEEPDQPWTLWGRRR